jgi:hypothetical protein
VPVTRRTSDQQKALYAGKRHAVDPSLMGRRVELRFAPEGLGRMDMFWEGRFIGQGILFIVGRHAHRQTPQPPRFTTIDRPSITWACSSQSLMTTCWAGSAIATLRQTLTGAASEFSESATIVPRACRGGC